MWLGLTAIDRGDTWLLGGYVFVASSAVSGFIAGNGESDETLSSACGRLGSGGSRSKRRIGIGGSLATPPLPHTGRTGPYPAVRRIKQTAAPRREPGQGTARSEWVEQCRRLCDSAISCVLPPYNLRWSVAATRFPHSRCE